MASSSRDLIQSVLCLQDSSGGHVSHSGEQGDTDLRFTLPGRQGLGGRRPLHILGRFRGDLCLPSSSHISPNSGKYQVLQWHDSDPHSLTTPFSAVASTSTATQPMSSPSVTGSSVIPVRSQPPQASVPPRPQAVGSGSVAIIREVLQHHQSPESVVEMQPILSETPPLMSIIPSGKHLPSGQMTKEYRPRTSPISLWQNT